MIIFSSYSRIEKKTNRFNYNCIHLHSQSLISNEIIYNYYAFLVCCLWHHEGVHESLAEAKADHFNISSISPLSGGDFHIFLQLLHPHYHRYLDRTAATDCGRALSRIDRAVSPMDFRSPDASRRCSDF